jgi:hypothetical protein
VIPLALAAVSLLAPASAGAGGVRSPLALAASPARIRLVGTTSRTVRVTNWGTTRLVADVGTAGFALGLRGRPRIVRRPTRASSAASWLTVRPARIVLPPGGTATLTVSSTVPRGAEPGDHPALVLVTTRPRAHVRIAVRMQVGIAVAVRAPGAVVHQLSLRSLSVRRDGRGATLELGIANLGNVTEPIGPGRLRVRLFQNGRVVARGRPARRELLPRSRGIDEVALPGRVTGRVTVLVELFRRGWSARRAFHLRL